MQGTAVLLEHTRGSIGTKRKAQMRRVRPARAYDTSHANTRFHSDKSGHRAVCSLRLYDSLAAKKREVRGVFLIPVDPTSI
jgi:hypothetical protein